MPDAASSTDTFLSLYLSLPGLSPNTILGAVLLALGRLVPIMILAPFFGTRNVPAAVRIMFSISILAIILPQVLFSLKHEIFFDIKFIGLFVKEVFIGFVLGLLITIPFYVAQAAGGLTDHMRGAQSLMVTDPTTQNKTGPIGIFYNYVLIIVFYMIGGPFLFLDGVGKSYTLIPLDQFFNATFFSLQLPLWKLLIGLFHYILSMAIQLAAPSLIGVLMAEMFLGIANRLAPQVQIVFLGISLKSWVGLALLAAAWFFIVQQLSKESISWLKVMNNTIEQTANLYKK